MTVCSLPWWDNYIIYYITIPETIVLGLTAYGIYSYLKTAKAIRNSPWGSLLGAVNETQSTPKTKTTVKPVEEDTGEFLPPP